MGWLSPHFAQSEFELDGPMPLDAVGAYTILCTTILEQVRARFGPIVITSGYRPPAANAAAHGQPNSEHMATKAFCAADFKIVSLKGDMRTVFDAMRNDPTLPWHQLILKKKQAVTPSFTSVGMERSRVCAVAKRVPSIT
jgi:hypothetical protein